jgi:hypothetical protein
MAEACGASRKPAFVTTPCIRRSVAAWSKGPFALYTRILADEQHLITPSMSHNPSHVRVFGKSLHLLAAGWTVAIAWLWVAELRQHVRRHDVLPPDFGMATAITGTLAAILLEALAILVVRWTGSAATQALQRREWHHAFWWSVFPNLMLLYTVYLLVFGIE